MSKVTIKAENIGKAYQLGQIGTGTISRDMERWYARMRGKDDPFLRIGESNNQHTKSESDVVWSLKNINVEIEQGDAVGIIGRNGAGKSTLLKILSKVTAPTTGKITGSGRIASLLEVGTGFHPELSGRENIFLNGAILGMRKKEIQRKLDEIVDFAGIERYLDTPVKRYSSGMYVRLAFAVAAHLESEILIVDEVLAVGDAEFQKKCLGKMNDVSKAEGRTVLFVSHHLNSIKNLCNKGILLEQGKIKFNGDIFSVISNYVDSGNRYDTTIDLSKIKYYNDNLVISDIRINQSNKNLLKIDDARYINVEIKGTTFDEMPLSIECIFYDNHKNVLGMYSPGHYHSQVNNYKGNFVLNEMISFPETLNHCYLTMDLNITLPGYENFASFPEIATLEIEGYKMLNGHSFSQEKGAGFIFLK